MAEVPGSVGWTVLSDKSIDFYSCPVSFVEKNIQHFKSRVFISQFLTKATVFVCSNQGVREVLANKDDAFVHGYRVYMEKVFGDNILFTDGEEASLFRDALTHLFTTEAIQSYQGTMHSITKKHVAELDPGEPLCLYKFFKKVVTEICLTLFLGLDFSDDEECARVVYHTLRHWHGIAAIPAQLKIPGTGCESAFCKAMTAKVLQQEGIVDLEFPET